MNISWVKDNMQFRKDRLLFTLKMYYLRGMPEAFLQYLMGDDWLRRCMLTNWTELEWNIQFCRGDGCCWVQHCWYEKEWTKKIERREGVRWYRSSSPPLWLRPALLPVWCVGFAGCQLSQKIYKWQMQILKARILSKKSKLWWITDYLTITIHWQLKGAKTWNHASATYLALDIVLRHKILGASGRRRSIKRFAIWFIWQCKNFVIAVADLCIS